MEYTSNILQQTQFMGTSMMAYGVSYVQTKLDLFEASP